MNGGGRVLADLATLGPFFAVAAHQPGAMPRPPWRPGSELADEQAGQPGILSRRIAATRATLAARDGRPVSEIELRAVASTVHLGLVARLAAPALGAAVLGWRADMRLDELWWQDAASGPVPLSLPDPAPVPAAGCGPPDDWAERLLRNVIVPVTDATSRAAVVSGHVLRGNAASGINAAAGQVARARPDLADKAWTCARALFASPWLSRERQPPGVAFRRSSCCLFYRLAADAPSARSAICGDCVLGA